MPGFRVGSEGGNNDTFGVSLSDRFKYTYTWEIDRLQDEVVGMADSRYLVYAKDVSLPAFNVSMERHIGSSLEYKFAKSVSYDDIKISFYDTQDLYKKLKQWRQSVYDWQTGIKTPEQYKKNSTIKIYDPTWQDSKGVVGIDNEAVSYAYDLVGSWPSVIRHGDLTYTSSDVKIVEVTLTYDFAVVRSGLEEYVEPAKIDLPTSQV